MKGKMKTFCKRVIAFTCALAMVLTGMISDLGTIAVKAAGEHTMWLVGDSTVCAFNDNYYYPRYGYGTQIGNYLDETYKVENLAASGRSSKDYLKEVLYNRLKSEMKSGDILVIGFGHNDEKREEARYTNPNGDWETAGSFAKSLYDNYVKIAEDAGAQPILCTPIVRWTDAAELSGDTIHVISDKTEGGVAYQGGDYPAAIRKLGTDKNIPVIDLTTLTKNLYEGIDPSERIYFHAWQSKYPDSRDATHLNIYGAKKVAWLFANAVKDSDDAKLATLAAHIVNADNEPTKAQDLEANPNFLPPEYDGNLSDSEIWADCEFVTGDGKDKVSFKGSVFGDMGGASNISAQKQTLGKDSKGNMHIAAGETGHIGGESDGIAMYYYKAPADQSLEFTATVTVNALNLEDAESAFGLMVRDDMYIDTNNANIASDYVVAGTVTNKGEPFNCFYRKGGVIKKDETMVYLEKDKLAVGNSYELSIKTTGDGYICTFGRETAQTGGYDFFLKAVDSNYVYVGMFAAGSADVTYSNVYLKLGDQVVLDNRAERKEVRLSTDGKGEAGASRYLASEGEEVVLFAVPQTGYMLKEWQSVSGGAVIEGDRFVMPAAAVTLMATFETLRTKWDFASDSEIFGSVKGVDIEGKTGITAGILVDATAKDAKWSSKNTENDNCVHLNKDTVIKVPVPGRCKVSLDFADANYTVDGQAAAGKEQTFKCKGEKGFVTIAATADTKLKSIAVAEDESPEARKIDVWDFGCLEMDDTEKYNNHITAAVWESLGISNKFVEYFDSKGSSKGICLVPGETTFGDLKFVYNGKGGDRIYTSQANVNKGIGQLMTNSYLSADYIGTFGYKPIGVYYSNNTCAANNKTLEISNVQAGDKIVLYAGSHKTDPIQMHFDGQGGDAAAQKEEAEVALSHGAKLEFTAEYSGTYKLWGTGGNPLYYRLVRIPGVTVSGTIDMGECDATDYTLKFMNMDTQKYTEAVVENGSYTVTLTAGYEYTAMLEGANGYGVSAAARTVSVAEDDVLTGKVLNLKIVSQQQYTYSGNIVGFADDYDISGLKITMQPDAEHMATSTIVPLVLSNGNKSFSAQLDPGTRYTIVLEGVNDYEVKTPSEVTSLDDDLTQDITVALKARQTVTGRFIGLGGVKVTKLTFTNVEDSYAYDANVTDDGYTALLREGSYLATATVTGYRTTTHVVVKDNAVSRDLMFVATGNPASVSKVSDIYVGYADQANNYATVSEAVKACEAMNLSSEADRVTIHIAPGTYREQIIVKAPYITLVNDSADEEVLLTWYYGIGYKYYSVGSTGYYDAERSYDRFDKANAVKWGTAVYVQSSATGFRAKGIVFENSFNRYVTDEEIEDGVELNPPADSKIAVARKYNTDVTSKAATERAAAMVIEASKTEFLNCSFLSSQDTLYTSGPSYFRNCLIEGQTDYIFGKGNAVFDACELRFKGYKGSSQGGYITAAKNTGGYLFRSCSVTANPDLTVEPGYFGRPWDADCKVTFLNTRLQAEILIAAKGWEDWNSNQLAKNANYYEYGTTLMDGTAVNTASRVRDVMTAEQAAQVNAADYFDGGWQPAYYVEEEATIAFATAPFIGDNGDINTPYPGHTLTVGYSLGNANNANDASLIQWYSVKGETETLRKESTAGTDKTYQIKKEDIGTIIKVVVTPATVSGKIGEAASCSLENTVYDGYEVPGKPGEAVLGDGVNIFLIGDSTVRDYSADGVFSNKKARDEGAWGEFLQSYFAKEKVTIVNYANGGRSTRNYINEGTLDTVKALFKKGDYVFIQFGHNDCTDDASYKADRYVPLGTPDANGIYPTTEGTKTTTPAELADKKYGSECYTWDCGGTYKWFLKQYIDAAREKGAVPVLVTPVSRMYYGSDGKITAHHDASSSTNKTNTYVTAVKQLAVEEDVLLIDGFELTKKMFEDAYADCGSDANGKQIMYQKLDDSGSGLTTDKTHNNKLGGMMEAAIMAAEIQKLELDGKPLNISYAVQMPHGMMGETTSGKTVFEVTNSSKLYAYDALKDYAEKASYWETYGQNLIDAIGVKAAELNAGNQDVDDTKVTITLVTNGGDSISPITIDKGTKLERIPSATRTGYKFVGWYSDAALTKAYDFATPVTANITLYAKWQQKGSNPPVIPDIPDTEGIAIVGLEESYPYTGAKIVPDIQVIDCDRQVYLAPGTDYTVTYKQNQRVGTATVVVNGKGNYAGKNAEKQFKIVEPEKPEELELADLKGAKIGKINAVEYNGEAQYPDLILTLKGGTAKTYLYSDGEYETADGEKLPALWTISGNKNKGTATILLTGAVNGSKATTVKATFKITAVDMSKSSTKFEVSVDESTYCVKGADATGVTVTYKDGDNEMTLIEGVDYTAKCAANKAAGTQARLTITGKGNFAKKLPVKYYTINKLDLGKTEVVAVKAAAGMKKSKVTATVLDLQGNALKAGKQYTLTVKAERDGAELGDNDKLQANDVLTVKAAAGTDGNTERETAEATFVVGADFSKAKISIVKVTNEKGKQVDKTWSYTGEPIELDGETDLIVTIKVGSETKTLKYGEDYEIVETGYSNNVKKGTATAILVGKGDYCGSKAVKFKIVAKTMKLN